LYLFDIKEKGAMRADHLFQQAGIYAIVSRTARRFYIGQAPVSLESRFRQHAADLAARRHFCAALQADCDRYGDDDIVFGVIAAVPEDIPDVSLLFCYERLSILHYATIGGGVYNATRLPTDLKAARKRAQTVLIARQNAWLENGY
jgi:hypothetical protein